ncbi:MAG: hypothetical protein KAR39_11540 [Thermoplasmata archaeon]|nr:hypothetical protein [Thermoplasmata archaeon]
MVVSIEDQLQSISGDLLGARVALDAEWSEAMEKHHYQDSPDSKKFVRAAKVLLLAQLHIDEARKQLKKGE